MRQPDDPRHEARQLLWSMLGMQLELFESVVLACYALMTVIPFTSSLVMCNVGVCNVGEPVRIHMISLVAAHAAASVMSMVACA